MPTNVLNMVAQFLTKLDTLPFEYSFGMRSYTDFDKNTNISVRGFDNQGKVIGIFSPRRFTPIPVMKSTNVEQYIQNENAQHNMWYVTFLSGAHAYIPVTDFVTE